MSEQPQPQEPASSSDPAAALNDDASPVQNNNTHTNAADDDEVSALSGTTSIASKASTIWSQAAMILRGENPNAAIPEEDETDADEALLGLDVPSGEQQQHAQRTANNSNMEGDHNDLNGINGVDESSNTATNKINFLDDDPKTMTLSRRLALFLLQRYSWYNPRLGMTTQQDDDVAVSEERPGDSTRLTQQQDNVTKNAAEAHLLFDQAYPFTHSRRENPSLQKAWAYFEHVALSRHVITETQEEAREKKKKKCILTRMYRKCFCKYDKQLKRAEPGEKEYPTALYSPIFTPHAQLGDFGLGIGLYFSALRGIMILTLLAGFINIANLRYFNSTEYQSNVSNFGSYASDTIPNVLLQGSAICTDVSWVYCDDCNATTHFDASRTTVGTHVDSGINATLYLRNECAPSNIQAFGINYASLLFVLLGMVGLSLYLRRMEIAFDEDEQTAQDYSVVVENPPGDATDPQEWHDFFHNQFDGAHLTACTIAVDNDLLVRALVERRELLRKMEMMVEPGTSLDTLTLAGIAARQERQRRFAGRLKAKLSPGIPELFARTTVLTAKVQGLAQQDYPATKVFLTFETEADQRKVLSAYNVGSRDANRNNTTKLADPRHLFRGNLVLKVNEPDEPNTVRWQDLNEKWKDCFKQQFFTFIATCGSIVAIAFLVRVLNDASVAGAAFTIAFFNSVFPLFAKILTNQEAHASEGGKQRSLYAKIALFRWVNTAVVITIITPFTSTLTNGTLINQIYALFFAEIVTTNAIQLLDPVGHLQRHILAPRASTQDAMNISMQGQVFELAERYTNMTKILFLSLWYCVVYPGALFMCSVALFINYFTDRFSLMRTWKRAPQLGTKISEFSRRYFFSLAIGAMAIMSSYYWSGFPYDNLCEIADETLNTTLTGLWEVQGADVTMSETMFKFCLQDFFRFPKEARSFPFIPAHQLEGMEWMTDDQEFATVIYGWSAVAVLILVLLRFFYSWYGGFMSYFRGSYEPRGDDQGINFSDVPSINSYVPQVDSPVFSYPLLACNIDGIDTDLLDWTDHDRPHSFYDLTKDASVLLRGTDVSSKVVFSQIAHWPPSPPNKMSEQSLDDSLQK